MGGEYRVVGVPEPLGVHKDAGKPRLDLVPHEGVLAAARALEYGLVKYPAHNYMHGLSWMALVGSILRHLYRWIWDGRPDPESGLDDLDHLCADVLMLAAIVRRHPGLDDRPCREFPPNDQK